METNDIYLLHGWSIDDNNREKWQDFMNALRNQDFNPHFLPIPGLDNDVENPWNLSDYVGWLEVKLPQHPVCLLGHSFGGQLAVRFASTRPERVASLILIACSGLRDKSIPAVLKRFVFKQVAAAGKIFTKNQQVRKLLYFLAREKDYLQADPIMRETMKNVIADEIRDDLKQITCPVLVIWGENDQTTPLKNGYYIDDKLADSELRIAAGVRHAPQFDEPNVVAKFISRFVRAAT